ncbi:MAG: CDP-diacylglycerol--glycerol-3-phosphate 3-phosphatidyltransferase [bacterium]|nr:CDP-diacylglycerol--glycerol-3-phosphate 3-phosphatidyltransferase [bacterium]
MKFVWNIPNVLTLLRFFSVPIFIYLLLQPDLNSRIIAFSLFALASITDLVDGYIARRFKQETELGKFMDPLADKALVTAAFLTFIFLSAQVQLWMVLIIIGRDMMITAMRWLAVRKNVVLRTSVFGKVKTAFQMFSITMILVSFLIISHKERGAINAVYESARAAGQGAYEVATENMLRFFSGPHVESVSYELASFVPYYLMLLTTVMTVISGLRYLVTNYKLMLPPYAKVTPRDNPAPDNAAGDDGN